MKKFILSIAAIIVFGCGCLGAQTSAMKITADKIEVFKPISLSGDASNIQIPWSLNLLLPKGTLSISTIMSQPIGGGTIIVNSNGNAAETNSSSFIPGGSITAVQINPSITNFMCLGTNNARFKEFYVNQVWSPNQIKTPSDIRFKENIEPIENATEKILALRPVSFDFKNTEEIQDTTDLKDKVGFIAQELMAVLPNLVCLIPETNMYAVEYASLIPYLVKAFQEAQEEKAALEEQTTELQEQVSELRDQLASLQEIMQSLLAQTEYVTTVSKNDAAKHSPKNTIQEAKLFQNLPNPFSEKTVIRYELPKMAGNAYLQVFDVSGRMLQNITLPHAQEIGQIEISAGELTPGSYTYSLVVSGKVVDSKRMVVTR